MSTRPSPAPSPYVRAMDALRLSPAEKEALMSALAARCPAAQVVSATPDISPHASPTHPAIQPAVSPAPAALSAPTALPAPASRKPCQTRRPRDERRAGGAPVSRRALVGLAAAAALALGTAGAAVATGLIRVDVPEALRRLFGADPSATDPGLLEQLGSPIGVSASSNGVSVTVDSLVGDRNNVCIVLTFARDDGLAFDDLPCDPTSGTPLVGFDGQRARFELEGSRLAPGCNSVAFKADPDDPTFQMQVTLMDDEPLQGRTVVAHIENVTTRANGQGRPALEPRTLVEGTWDLTFPLAFTDTSRAFETGQTLHRGAMEATVVEARVSPLSLTVRCEAATDDEALGRMSPEEQAKATGAISKLPISLLMDDGSRVVAQAPFPYEGGVVPNSQSNSNGMRRIGMTNRWELRSAVVFRELIDVERVVAIEFGGLTLGALEE